MTFSIAKLFSVSMATCVLCLATTMMRAAESAAAPVATPATAASAADEEGFVKLFDGKTLDGWIGATKGYQVVDGVLVCPKTGGGNLYTAKEYADFVFRFEFKLTPGANNGLGIRAPTTGDAAYTGMELQILDDTAPQYKNLQKYQYHGSIYGIVAAERGHLKPVGEWNSQEVTAKGRRITVKLNDKVIVDADLDEATKDGTVDKKNHPGLKNTSGHIGFLGHGTQVEFRNIRIKDLGGKAAAETKTEASPSK